MAQVHRTAQKKYVRAEIFHMTVSSSLLSLLNLFWVEIHFLQTSLIIINLALLLAEMREPPYYSHYSKARLFIHNIVTSKYFDLAIAAVIGLNVVTMAMEFYKMPKVCLLLRPFHSWSHEFLWGFILNTMFVFWQKTCVSFWMS